MMWLPASAFLSRISSPIRRDNKAFSLTLRRQFNNKDRVIFRSVFSLSASLLIVPERPGALGRMLPCNRRVVRIPEYAQSVEELHVNAWGRSPTQSRSFAWKFVHERRWRLLDPHGIVLKNMNAPEDYDEARNWLRLKSLNEGEHIKRSQPPRKRKPRSAPRRNR